MKNLQDELVFKVTIKGPLKREFQKWARRLNSTIEKDLSKSIYSVMESEAKPSELRKLKKKGWTRTSCCKVQRIKL